MFLQIHRFVPSRTLRSIRLGICRDASNLILRDFGVENCQKLEEGIERQTERERGGGKKRREREKERKKERKKEKERESKRERNSIVVKKRKKEKERDKSEYIRVTMS